MTEQVSADERVIDVRQIDPRQRHIVILQLFEHLPASGALQLIADHDPKPLRFQIESKYGGNCLWAYLEEGPDVWRVRLRNVPTREKSNG
ncbi:hemerythrin [Mesorhizobium sp. Root157]|uniref:DUF2249 domain-containing protein n=1 Tax=Mesorhizobium sp. Root157 TaxID=1736477 RepID=UPI0006F85481|nr:DUF2249 domain-containing protein [Mesorhizobium sp. Root157]KQZ99883.1 hemerythrin [Mesorhizobium sp. Root157]